MSLLVQFLNLHYDNRVLMNWSVQGTKTTQLVLVKGHILAFNTCSGRAADDFQMRSR